MEEAAKYILLGFLMLPFAALVSDAIGKTRGLLLWVVVCVATASILLSFMMGGLHQRPNIAKIFGWAFVAWPILLLFAKGINSSISWRTIWLSVPIMSWYLVILSMQFYYPANGGGGGMGAGLGLAFGWLYMAIPFALMSAIFVGIRAFTVRPKVGQTSRRPSPETEK